MLANYLAFGVNFYDDIDCTYAQWEDWYLSMPEVKILPFDPASLQKGDIVQFCETCVDGVVKPKHSQFYLGNLLYISAFGSQGNIAIHKLEESISRYSDSTRFALSEEIKQRSIQSLSGLIVLNLTHFSFGSQVCRKIES